MNVFSKILNSFFGKVPEETRPRFGMLTRADGSTEFIVFHQVTKDQFVPKLASTEQIVLLGPGDRIKVDVIGPGQCVIFETHAGIPNDYDG